MPKLMVFSRALLTDSFGTINPILRISGDNFGCLRQIYRIREERNALITAALLPVLASILRRSAQRFFTNVALHSDRGRLYTKFFPC